MNDMAAVLDLIRIADRLEGPVVGQNSIQRRIDRRVARSAP
jgi:hypothetical protein